MHATASSRSCSAAHTIGSALASAGIASGEPIGSSMLLLNSALIVSPHTTSAVFSSCPGDGDPKNCSIRVILPGLLLNCSAIGSNQRSSSSPVDAAIQESNDR